ncbi:3-deoxy-D-manno-octulosonic acid transferase [Granulicella sibirica]|uniref:3-deoxy-D-manno-octulosonic acid transferase n=1 Tax=Granulicella sibirica TaxID=2479048 RepID=A0A4Q0T620_9BACT|nr:3-deoxy-D-manno-octulosonic acid transferase [Granulicella sibirica]RXH57066.1 Lipid IVA 3-deoxy-D-manno-octulosonic acid transferase [Granulicella sibirica]
MVLWVYSSLFMLVMVVGAPWWVLRMTTSGRYRAGLLERLGMIPAGLREAVAELDGKDLIWVHAVSVGEVLASTALVRELRKLGYGVAVSTTTQAGQELARARFIGCPVFYVPLDFAFLMRRYLQVLKPRLVVTMESELWPNLIHTCKREGIPLAVVNARVSDRSFPRYMRLKAVWGPLLREVSVFLAQSEETAGRLREMGVAAERVVVAGNLKYDVVAGTAGFVTEWLKSLLAGERLVVAGSTLGGEEEMLLGAWAEVRAADPDAALLIAPRHTNRFEEVAALIEAKGFGVVRASRMGEAALDRNAVILLDTIGDLATVYGVADVAFVGGSLMKKGGHNPLEPARFGVPVAMGESYENFREIVGAMKEADAIRIVRREELGGVLAGLLVDREGAKAMGARGRQVFEAQAGATGRVVATLVGLMRGEG